MKKLQSLFFWSEEDARLELSQLHRFISTLFTLVRAYDKKLSELKAKKNILSFADIESLTVKLLAKPDDDNVYTKTVHRRAHQQQDAHHHCPLFPYLLHRFVPPVMISTARWIFCPPKAPSVPRRPPSVQGAPPRRPRPRRRRPPPDRTGSAPA